MSSSSRKLLFCGRLLSDLCSTRTPRAFIHFKLPLKSEHQGLSEYQDKKSVSSRQSSSRKLDDDASEKLIRFDKDSDRFGTLSSDRRWRREVEAGDDEDPEVEEINFIDGKEGKVRLKPINYAMMIKEHLNNDRLADALFVYENTMLQEHKAKPDIYIYNLLISGCGKHGYTKKAFQLFNQMKKRGLLPRLSTYTSLFNACANGPWDRDSLERAKHLRELMIEKRVQPNTVNYNAMIKAFGRHGDLETSFSLMDEMISKKISIDLNSFNFLLQAAISDKEAGFRHALLVWKKMMEMKIRPNHFTFNLLLRSVRDCGLGDADSAQELINVFAPSGQSSQELLSGGQTNEQIQSLQIHDPPNLLLPTPKIGSLVVITSRIKKPWERLMLLGSAGGFLDTMHHWKANPDIKTFSILLDSLPPSSKAEEELINEMKQRKVKIDISFCNMLIKKRTNRSQFADAMDVLKLISKEKLTPDIMTYGVLALACNTHKAAKQLLNDVKNTGFRVNVQILSALLKKAKVGLDIDLALLAVKTLIAEGVVPDKKFFQDLSSFRDTVIYNLELKESGKPCQCNINSEHFNEKFSKLLSLLDNIKDQIRDPSDIHPWAQFKKPLKESSYKQNVS